MAEDFSSLTDKWIGLLRDHEDNEAVDFYCEQIVPVLAPCLRKRFAESYSREPAYDGLISLLGFTPETTIIAYQFAQPDTLVVLHTPETATILDKVVQHTQIPASSFYHEPFTEQPLRNIYVALERALNRFPQGSKVAIELTGGKKTMGGALAVAAGMLDIDLLYIDYAEYMPDFRKPKPATTYIHLVENPMRTSVDLFGGLDIHRALEIFNIGKLDVAEELLRNAANRMGSPRIAELCASLAGVYSAWNRFDFVEAAQLGESLFEQALQFYHEVDSEVRFDLRRLKVQLLTIEALRSRDRTTVLQNFYFTAERYEKNDHHDISALLYYRALEDIFANRLADLAPKFERDNPDFKCLEIPDISQQFCDAKSRLLKLELSAVELPSKLALIDTLVLLDVLGDECFQAISRQRILGLTEVRNNSIFAHGHKPMNAQSIQGLKKLATECLDLYLVERNLGTIDESRDSFTFMPLKLQGDDVMS